MDAARRTRGAFGKIVRFITFFLGGALILLGMLAAANDVATPHEKKHILAPGVMVDVHGNKMHIFAQGQRKRTTDPVFVILSGGGVGVPALEYRPLCAQLAKLGRVAVVEYFGYGWSEETTVPRTAENVVNEIREALAKADLQPPYVLVPHSMSGIYAMTYAKEHREELAAIVALDTTLPRGLLQAREHGERMPTVGSLALLRKLGIMRFVLWFDPLLISGAPKGVYTAKEAQEIAAVTNWNYGNATLENEYAAIEDNMEALLDTTFPKDLPVLMIQASGPNQQAEKIRWARSERGRLLEDLNCGKLIELPAGHSGIYWLLSDQIAAETEQFLRESLPQTY